MGRKVGTILSFTTILFEIISALFFTPFLIKSFGQSEYGVYTLTLSVTSYLALLDLGIGNSVVKFVAQYRAKERYDEQNRFLSLISVYYAIITLLIIVLGIFLFFTFPAFFSKGLTIEEVKLAQRLVLIASVNIAVTIGTSYFYYTIIAYENFFISKGVPLAASILRIVISFILLLKGFKSIEISLLNLFITFLSRLIMVFFVFCKMKFRYSFKGIEKKLVKSVISFSGIVLLQMIATQLNSMCDQILIGIIVPLSSAIIAVYGLGAQLIAYYQTLANGINGVIMPGVVKMIEKNPDTHVIQNEMSRIGRMNLTFLGIVWAVFLVYGKQFILLWSGEDYFYAYYVAILLMTPQLIIQTQLIGSQVLWAMNKHRAQAILKFVIVLANIVLTIVLIKWNPLLGATIGTFIALVLGDVVVMQLVFKKEIGIGLADYYKSLLKGIWICLIVTILIGFLFSLLNLSGWGGFIINCSVMLIVYFLMLLVVGFSENEKQFFLKFIRGEKRKAG